jgi:hypothetical protein
MLKYLVQRSDKPYSIHAFICFDQLNKFLNSQIELYGRLEFTQLRAIIIAPFKALGGLVPCEGLLNLTGNYKHICKKQYNVNVVVALNSLPQIYFIKLITE